MGRWNIFVSWPKADQYWQGKLPDGVVCIKIKGRHDGPENPTILDERNEYQNSAVIIVVNDDWTDEETTVNIGRHLQNYKMETNFPLIYIPSITNAIKADKAFKNVKLPKLYPLHK